MMRTIHLHGKLGDTFGKSFRFDVATAGEGLRALYCAFPTLIADLREGHYRIIRGDFETGMDIGLEHINGFKLGEADLHILPVAVGSKSSSTSGTVKLIAGVALVGAAIFLSGGTLAAPLAGFAEGAAAAFTIGGMGVSWGTIAAVGLGLALSGASQLLAKTQKPEDAKSSSSYTFSGPVNVNAQGYAINLIYGECIVGSQPVSSGMDVENIGSGTSGVSLFWSTAIKASETP